MDKEDKRKQQLRNQLQLWPNIVSVNVLSKSLLHLMTCEVRVQAYKIIAVIMSSRNHTQNLHNTYSLRTSVLWDVARGLVVGFRRFGTTHRSHLQIPTYAALRHRRAKTSNTPRRKSGVLQLLFVDLNAASHTSSHFQAGISAGKPIIFTGFPSVSSIRPENTRTEP